MTADSRPVLRFYYSHSRDATSFVEYRYAPSDWDDMSKEEQIEWLDEEAKEYFYENVEWGAYEVDPDDWEYDPWEQGNSINDPEDFYS